MGKALKSRLRARSPSATFLLSSPSFVLLPFSGLVLHFPLYFRLLLSSEESGRLQPPLSRLAPPPQEPPPWVKPWKAGSGLAALLRRSSSARLLSYSCLFWPRPPFSAVFPGCFSPPGIRQAPAAVSSARTASPGASAMGKALESRLRARSPSATFLLSPPSFRTPAVSWPHPPFSAVFPGFSSPPGYPGPSGSSRRCPGWRRLPGAPAPGEGVLLQAPEHGPGNPGREFSCRGCSTACAAVHAPCFAASAIARASSCSSSRSLSAPFPPPSPTILYAIFASPFLFRDSPQGKKSFPGDVPAFS